MPRLCTVCAHPERAAVDAALVTTATYRTIAHRFALSEDALKRHKGDHLPAALAQAQEAATMAQADSLLQQVADLKARAVTLLERAERAGDIRSALAGIREARACLELLLEVEGELDRRPVVNVLMSAEWLAVRSAMLAALQPYPEARQDVAGRLAAVERAS